MLSRTARLAAILVIAQAGALVALPAPARASASLAASGCWSDPYGDVECCEPASFCNGNDYCCEEFTNGDEECSCTVITVA